MTDPIRTLRFAAAPLARIVLVPYTFVTLEAIRGEPAPLGRKARQVSDKVISCSPSLRQSRSGVTASAVTPYTPGKEQDSRHVVTI